METTDHLTVTQGQVLLHVLQETRVQRTAAVVATATVLAEQHAQVAQVLALAVQAHAHQGQAPVQVDRLHAQVVLVALLTAVVLAEVALVEVEALHVAAAHADQAVVHTAVAEALVAQAVVLLTAEDLAAVAAVAVALTLVVAALAVHQVLHAAQADQAVARVVLHAEVLLAHQAAEVHASSNHLQPQLLQIPKA